MKALVLALLPSALMTVGCTHGTGQGACRRIGDRAPTDHELIACFTERHADLERLVQLIRSEQTAQVVGDDNIDACWKSRTGWDCGVLAVVLARAGLTRPRYDEYLRALSAVGAYRVIHWRDAEVSIAVHRQGIAPSGATKNFLWSPLRVPTPLVVDTDADRAAHDLSFARVAPDWYIEHENN